MPKIRVLLVDDHTVVRRGLRRIVESVPDLEVVGEAGNGVDGIDAALSLQPDVVLMDVSLPGINGIQAAREIRTALPATQVLMLSMHAEDQYIDQSLAAGARGYLIKDTEDQDLVGAIFEVARGNTYVPAHRPGYTSSSSSVSPEVLSPRERQVLTMICAGRTNREMAHKLGLSPNTVETHRKHIIEKLDLHSTAELVRYAIRNGLAS